MAKTMNGYVLSRKWFDFIGDNPSKVKPAHTSLYFWCVDLWNRLGQPAEFSLPFTTASMAMGVTRHDTFKKCFNELSDWGFIKIVQVSKNQFKANVIELCLMQNEQGTVEALSKAPSKQTVSTEQGTVHVIEPLELLNLNEQKKGDGFKNIFLDWRNLQLPDGFGEPFKTAWKEWEQHRYEKNKPITSPQRQKAIEAVIRDCGFNQQRCVDVLVFSMEKGYEQPRIDLWKESTKIETPTTQTKQSPLARSLTQNG